MSDEPHTWEGEVSEEATLTPSDDDRRQANFFCLRYVGSYERGRQELARRFALVRERGREDALRERADVEPGTPDHTVAPATFMSPGKATLTITQNDVDIANDICGAVAGLPESLRPKLFNAIVTRIAMERLK
jgi:hypothetical protein